MDRFLTTYRMDFIPMPREPQYPVSNHNIERTYTVQEDNQFILDCDAAAPDCSHPTELANEYLETTFKNAQPKLANIYFKAPISTDLEQNLDKESIYVKDYGKYKDIREKLPEIDLNTIVPKLTTQRASYKPIPASERPAYSPRGSGECTLTKYHNIITSVQKAKLHSEYAGVIGTIGANIIERQMHGQMDHSILNNKNKQE